MSERGELEEKGDVGCWSHNVSYRESSTLSVIGEQDPRFLARTIANLHVQYRMYCR